MAAASLKEPKAKIAPSTVSARERLPAVGGEGVGGEGVGGEGVGGEGVGGEGVGDVATTIYYVASVIC